MADGLTVAGVATAAGAGLGGATFALTGSFLGIQTDALTLALFGGMAALLHLPPLPGIVHKFGSVWTAALLGGLLAPLLASAAPYVGQKLGIAFDIVAVRLACAFLVGLVSQPAIPIAFSLLKRKGDAA